MAQQHKDITKSMADVPLDVTGVKDAKKLASQLKALHLRADSIFHNKLDRTKETAEELQSAIGGVLIDTRLATAPWSVGKLEGLPVPEAMKELKPYISNPDVVVPGKGTISALPGESYNQFKHRFLGWLSSGPMKASPNAKVIVVTHSHNQKLLLDWVDAGCPDDFITSEENILLPASPPASAKEFFQDARGKWKLNGYAPATMQRPWKGILIVRHGDTILNAQKHDSAVA